MGGLDGGEGHAVELAIERIESKNRIPGSV